MLNVEKIGLRNMGTVNKNMVFISGKDEKGNNRNITLYFSYETIVGIEKDYNTYCLQNYWSTTTGKLLNEIESDKSKRLSQEDFDKVLNSIFN